MLPGSAVGTEKFSSSQFSGESAQSGGKLRCVSSRVQQLHHCWSQAVPEHKVMSDVRSDFLGYSHGRPFFFQVTCPPRCLGEEKPAGNFLPLSTFADFDNVKCT